MGKKQLIIIPGLGDRGGLYNFFKPLWILLGYEVHIFVFGWEEWEADNLASDALEKACSRLLHYIDKLATDQVYIIGVSAGGTAAVNALALRPAKVTNIVSVCTPFQSMPNLGNNLLNRSIAEAQGHLRAMNANTKDKILSVYGLYDQTVPARQSKPGATVDIKSKRIWALGHGPSILLALTLYAWPIKRFLDS